MSAATNRLPVAANPNLASKVESRLQAPPGPMGLDSKWAWSIAAGLLLLIAANLLTWAGSLNGNAKEGAEQLIREYGIAGSTDLYSTNFQK